MIPTIRVAIPPSLNLIGKPSSPRRTRRPLYSFSISSRPTHIALPFRIRNGGSEPSGAQLTRRTTPVDNQLVYRTSSLSSVERFVTLSRESRGWVSRTEDESTQKLHRRRDTRGKCLDSPMCGDVRVPDRLGPLGGKPRGCNCCGGWKVPGSLRLTA